MSGVKIIRALPAGDVDIPPSKSLGHRALICAGLSALQTGGESVLAHLGESDDMQATRVCLESLGVAFAEEDGRLLVRPGRRAGEPIPMDCNESGSTLRFLLPVAALYPERFVFTGRGRLMERPLAIYERLFAEKGAQFARQGTQIAVQGPLANGEYHLPGDISSQFVSGLLFALPLLPGKSRIVLDTALESAAYVDMTLDVMRHFGVPVRRENDRTFVVDGAQSYQPRPYRVESDYSQAAFFLAAGALGRHVRCQGMSDRSLQGDIAIVDILRRMGADVALAEGGLQATADALNAVDVDVREIPDLVPVLCVLCALAQGTSHITGAARLRLKESDRLHAMTVELQKLGAWIEQGPDSLTITGQPYLTGGAVDAHGDHRIAMALAVAGIRCRNPVTLTGWEHVKKSYPHFWEDFERSTTDG